MKIIGFSWALCFLIVVAVAAPCVAASESVSSQNIANAKNALSQSYIALANAERLGANVSVLASNLNNAASLINEAEDDNASGNFQSALSKADLSMSISNEVLGNATLLYNSSYVKQNNSFWSSVAFSVGGAIVFLIVAFVFWTLFSRRYNKKLLKMKVGVT